MKPGYLTPRQAFGALAVVLGLTLAGLLLYLVILLQPRDFTEEGGVSQAGLRPVLSIAGPGTGSAPKFSRPMGVAWGPNGWIYVADTGNDRVCVFDDAGEFLFEFGGKGVEKPLPGAQRTWLPGLFSFPTGIDVAANGDVYVADFRNDQVQVFNRRGRFVRRFPDPQAKVGRGGSGQEGTGIAVTDISVVAGRVYAADTYQVFIFETDGKIVEQWGRPGGEPGNLDHPNGIVSDGERVFVSDSNHNRVTAFTEDGEAIWNAGEWLRDLRRPVNYTMVLPRGLTLMENGDVLVADAFDHSLVRITSEGALVGKYGMRGTLPAQLNFPNDVDERKGRLLVADKENNRVQVVELVEP